MDVKTLILTTFEKTKLNMLELELILAFVLKKSREFVLTHPEYNLTSSQIKNFKLKIKNFQKGWPVAYLTGHKEFYGLDFIVNKNVLIPEPETELMVDVAMKYITHNTKHVTLIDVGTGSGNIIISLAKLAKKLSSGYPKLSFKLYGTDISQKALAVARKNAKLHKIVNKIKFLQGNLLKPILKTKIFPPKTDPPPAENQKSKIIILANLPYLTPKQIKNSPTIQEEPRLALSSGTDGLKYYRQLFKQIKKLQVMSYELRDIFVLCEIDPSQVKTIKALIKKELPGASTQIKKDLCGHNRLAIINLKRKKNT